MALAAERLIASNILSYRLAHDGRSPREVAVPSGVFEEYRCYLIGVREEERRLLPYQACSETEIMDLHIARCLPWDTAGWTKIIPTA